MRGLVSLALLITFTAPAGGQLAPPNPAGITYGHVHLNVKSLDVQTKLWATQFGGTIVQKGPLTVAKLPGLVVAFRETPDTGPSEGTVVDRLGLAVRDLSQTLKNWRAAGYRVVREFSGPEGSRNAILLGPDDLKIELQEDSKLGVVAAAHHVNFLVADPTRLRQWYMTQFSAVPRKRGAIDVTADVPGMNLSFEKSETPTVGTKGHVIDHIGFEINDLRTFVKKLESSGMTIDVPYREIPALGVNIAYITDPSGVYIELTEGYSKY